MKTPEQELEDLINAALDKADEIDDGRNAQHPDEEDDRTYEHTVCTERLREAQLWNTRDIQKREGN